MESSPGRTLSFDGTNDDQVPAARGVQQLWREQNAAFRAKMLEQIRHVRPSDDRAATA